jgi:hypothetical protein
MKSALADTSDLMKEMQLEARQDAFWAMFNYVLAVALFAVAVTSSVLAAVAGATDDLRNRFRGWIAVFAALPALVISIV